MAPPVNSYFISQYFMNSQEVRPIQLCFKSSPPCTFPFKKNNQDNWMNFDKNDVYKPVRISSITVYTISTG